VRIRAGRWSCRIEPVHVIFVGLVVLLSLAFIHEELANLAAVALATMSTLLAVLALDQSRRSQAEEGAARKLERLERVGELVGELGERVADASTRRGTLPWALAVFTQRRLLVALAIVGDEFALPACRALLEREVDANHAQPIYDGTKAALVEIANAIESASRGSGQVGRSR
jgi:hypothetical protein